MFLPLGHHRAVPLLSHKDHLSTFWACSDALGKGKIKSNFPLALKIHNYFIASIDFDFAKYCCCHLQALSESQKLVPATSVPLVHDPDTGEVVSGTLEELIHELVPRAHIMPTEKYQFAFLLR